MSRPVILYACVHNGGRSLAAKVLTEHERGLSTAGETPTLLTRHGVEQADVVVTMGCGEACSAVPGTRIVDGPLEDPLGQELPAVRRIVVEVEQRVLALLAELGVPIG